VNESPILDVETDPRFPSGRWLGFFEQKYPLRGRFDMELRLTFRRQVLEGEGRDLVGPFTVRGRYNLEDGCCYWTKRYQGKHDVFYRGFNEGKGIWGVWEIGSDHLRGGFHIWPEGMGDPRSPTMTEAAELPREESEAVEFEQPLAVPVGGGMKPGPVGTVTAAPFPLRNVVALPFAER
jgi:hypothetical protein